LSTTTTEMFVNSNSPVITTNSDVSSHSTLSSIEYTDEVLTTSIATVTDNTIPTSFSPKTDYTSSIQLEISTGQTIYTTDHVSSSTIVNTLSTMLHRRQSMKLIQQQ
jgi:hypothetical protein